MNEAVRGGGGGHGWRRLGQPEAFGRGASQVLVFVVCSLLIGAVGALDAILEPTVTLGTLLLLVVLAATWMLSARTSAIVSLEGMAAPLVAARVGNETTVAAEVKVAAIALMAVTVRLAVRALRRSHVALQERSEELARANERLERVNASLERFTGDAAHELRAPLALMHSEIDVALASGRRAEDYQRHLQRLAAEVRRMGDITQSLLVLAQADAGALDLATSARDLDVVDFFLASLSRWREVAERQGGHIVAHLPEDGRLRGDADLLARVVDNLLDNALRHGRSGGTVSVDVERHDDTWVMCIADDGSGVPRGVRPRLFERFVRGDRSHRRGPGLGLALTAAIVQAHNGSIRLDDDAGPGARFVVTLPAVDTDGSDRSLDAEVVS